MKIRKIRWKDAKGNVHPLTDPDPSMHIDDVKKMYAASPGMSDLLNAAVGYVEENGETVYEFTVSTGKKG